MASAAPAPAAAAAGPDVLAPYFGAFGPPTLGHYEAMKMSAAAHLRDFPGSRIRMMWMPTAGGSKAHLFPTKDHRIFALNQFNCKLSAEPEFKAAVDSGKLSFEASSIEYDIFERNGLQKADEIGKPFEPAPGKGDSSTIFTLLELRRRYPAATITVTMGIDNLLDLPWWYRSYQYPQLTNVIYVANRALPPVSAPPTATDAAEVFIEPGKKVSVKYISGLLFRAADPNYPVPLKDRVDGYPKNGYRDTGYSLQTYVDHVLPSLSVRMLGTPTSTSSSMLRCVIKKIVAGDETYVSSFKKLVGIDKVEAGPWMTMVGVFGADDDGKCAGTLAELEKAGLKGGYRRSKNNRKQKTRNNRKQKTRNNRKQKTRNNRRSRNNRN